MVYFHHKLNCPPLTGAELHSHEILKTMKDLGFKIYIFVLETEQRPVVMRDNWIYEEVFISKNITSKKRMKKKFSDYLDKVVPDYIFINYASWDFILDHKKYAASTRIIYNHHFESIRLKMTEAYLKKFKDHFPSSIDDVHPELYSQDFFINKNFTPDPEEYRIYNQYDFTLAIEDFGAPLIKQKCSKTTVISFPVTLSPRDCKPKYQKLALYTMSPYTFAFQGYYFFVKKILPLIVKKAPLFRTRVIGLGSDLFFPAPNMVCKNYVLDLKAEYQQASLSLSPAFSGTGQQIKIIESMHFAVPPVAMRNPMQFNPIEHAKTGFIADTAEEFAHYTLQLYLDRDLAQTMGKKAQEVAQSYYNHQLLKNKLRSLLEIKKPLKN